MIGLFIEVHDNQDGIIFIWYEIYIYRKNIYPKNWQIYMKYKNNLRKKYYQLYIYALFLPFANSNQDYIKINRWSSF